VGVAGSHLSFPIQNLLIGIFLGRFLSRFDVFKGDAKEVDIYRRKKASTKFHTAVYTSVSNSINQGIPKGQSIQRCRAHKD